MVGIFVSHDVNPAIPSGILYGNWSLLYKQCMVTVLSAAFSFIATYIILVVFHKTIGIRVEKKMNLVVWICLNMVKKRIIVRGSV